MSLNKETRTGAGVSRAIAWLRERGRPILADKMERELLQVNRQQTEAQPIQNPCETSEWIENAQTQL